MNISDLIKAYPLASFSIMIVSFSVIGYMIVTRYLMEKQIHNIFSKIIFTLTFVCSLSLLAIYLYEISNIQLSSSLWDIILSTLVIICTIVIPIALLLKLPYATKHIKIVGTQSNIPLIAFALITLYLWVLYTCSEQIRAQKNIDSSISPFTKSQIKILVEILVHYGVVIMALMSAYGSIWVPYIYFNHHETQLEDLQAAKKKVKSQIFFIIEQIKKNKYSIIKLKQQQQAISESLNEMEDNNQRMSLFSRSIKTLRSAIGGSTEAEKRKQLSLISQKIDFHYKQIETLNRVHHESFSIYKQIADEERKHMISQTIIGKFFRFFSLILTIYSITKVLLTAWNMINGRKLNTDPITRVVPYLPYLFPNFFFNEDTAAAFKNFSQYISFGFMGYLMISSVRSFSMNLKNFIDFILRRRGLNMLSTDTLVLLLSEMYGIYFLSAVILLQSGLPRRFIGYFQDIINYDKERLINHFTWFDKIFFWGCIVSLIFIAICQYQRKQKMGFIKERNFVEVPI